MTTLADKTISALRAGHDALAGLVRGFSPADLERPSAASEWTVSQVLSHLGSGAEIGLATLTSAQAGTPAPGGDFNPSVWARWDAMTPAEHAAGFLESDQRLVEAYEAMDATTRADLRIDLGFLPEPLDVAGVARFRLGEFALHRWDIEVVFGPLATLAPESVPLLLDQIAFMLGWTGKTGPLNGREATLLLRLADPDQAHGLRFADQVSLVEVPADPDGELSLSAEAWLRLATGRLAPQYTPESVKVTGALSLDDLRAVFPGF